MVGGKGRPLRTCSWLPSEPTGGIRGEPPVHPEQLRWFSRMSIPESNTSKETLPLTVPLVAVIGPTAVGKTGLVLELAERLGGEVVSVDSLQVYRHMDIGTAKPTPEERHRVRHHLIDLVNPDEEYHVGHFIPDAEKACREIGERGRVPLLTGGTGLYLKGFQEGLFAMASDIERTGENAADIEKIRTDLNRALREEGREVLHQRLAEIDPVSAARIHPNDTSRLLRALEVFALTGHPWSAQLALQQSNPSHGQARKSILKIGLMGEREWLYERINRRAAQMLRDGLMEEIETLLAKGFGRELKPMQAIGYRHGVEFLAGTRDRTETLTMLAQDTRHYAKRQLTWFRRDPEITWFRPEQLGEIVTLIERYLENFR